METANLRLQRIKRSSALPAPRFRYTPAIVAGPFVFVFGLVGLDPETGKLAVSGTAAETAQILRNLRLLCEEHRWSIERILFARVFCVSDVSAEVNSAWEEFFAIAEPSARSFMVVNALPLSAAVEIEFQLLV
ncbi:RidA family protein [Paraburkholderia sp. Cpub6]|uniref:RidA family protein n=1 Tax=Paraburkholderia sp. Cpub6 TaxID=2723094 RepID=UPI00161A939B|nr:RidA family protein [Paraburkholderia sp. Cpub6]MBB5460235.1 2-iminobutanoate/2-iminopropanoate deaminase [Paraburkholderia sp. Cpub6]